MSQFSGTGSFRFVAPAKVIDQNVQTEPNGDMLIKVTYADGTIFQAKMNQDTIEVKVNKEINIDQTTKTISVVGD
ncbi:hypothetical protein [Brevibacillus borstelensis]|uniref:hypothetical protein n=1 Tax=Brevibacillus borstelensis TaxID=45462 RepID=UPI00242B02C0|nr:hypothetical protein [Brevibacillus borstelensis]